LRSKVATRSKGVVRKNIWGVNFLF